MRTSNQGRSRAYTGSGKVTVKIVLMVLLATALAALQACGGSSHPNYVAPTTNNPAPGVQLVSIAITPSSSLIGIGENRQLVATGTYSDGTSNIITSSVTWASISTNTGSTTTTPVYVSVNSSGVATGVGIGAASVTATSGSVVGALQLTVDAVSFDSSTLGILSVPYKSSIVSAAYLPQQILVNGADAVQEVNLDANDFSSSSVTQSALLASVPMPAKFVPNATAANQSSFLVAVISYTSPDIQIIDASNISSDLASNTVVNTFTSPVTQSVTFYAGTPQEITCMICAAVVNPVTSQLLLSTAQGFYAMDFSPTSSTYGQFTLLFPTSAAAPTPNFSLNPIATPDPYIVAPNPTSGEVQILDLTTAAVNVLSPGESGVTTPAAATIDPLSGDAAVVDAATNLQSVLDLSNPAAPTALPQSGLGVCPQPQPGYLNMASLAISENLVLSGTAHTLFTSQTSGNCVGVEALWPYQSGPFAASSILYGYGTMPVTPDSLAFANGADANAINSFNSVYDKGNYAVLVDGSSTNNEQWIAKVNLPSLISAAGLQLGTSAVPLPTGSIIPTGPLDFLCAETSAFVCSYPTVTYLPTPSTQVTTSVNNIAFGSLTVGASSPPISVTLANIGPAILDDQIAVQGPNAADFALTYNCALQLQPASTCTITVTFTPSTTAAESALLAITGDGSSNPNYLCPSAVEGQTVCLSGSGAAAAASVSASGR